MTNSMKEPKLNIRTKTMTRPNFGTQRQISHCSGFEISSIFVHYVSVERGMQEAGERGIDLGVKR